MKELSEMNDDEIVAWIRSANAQLEALHNKRKEMLAARVEEIDALCEQLGIQPHTLFPNPSLNMPPVKPKYRSKDGNEWSGKGRKPSWLKQALEGLTEEQQQELLEKLETN